jgi:uroporphyrin-3 C-methyltransferase
MAQDKKSKSSKTSDALTPQGEKEVAGMKNSTSSKKDDLSTAESLAKLESEIKASRDAEKAKPENSKEPEEEAPSNKSSVKSNNSPDKISNKSNTKTPSASSDAATPKNKRNRSWLAIFAFIFSLLTAAFVGFFWWQSQIWLQNQEKLDQLKQQAVINTQQSLNDLQAKLTQLQLVTEKKQTQAQDNTVKINDSLGSLAARIKELGQSQPNYWLAAEAGYLINLAERRLLVEQDVNTAVQLLLDANQRLTAMQDPSVFHIRTAISEDVASLYTIKQPDSDSVYLAISGLIAEAKTIKFAQVYIPKPNINKEQQPEVSSEVNDWLTNILTSFKRFFGNFINITQRDAQVQPQLPVDQKWFVRANLTTQMLMAQNAILDKNQARYNDALKHIETWITQYFDNTDDAVISFMITLNTLQQQDIGLALPSGLNAQPLIANYLQQQLSLKEKQ